MALARRAARMSVQSGLLLSLRFVRLPRSPTHPFTEELHLNPKTTMRYAGLIAATLAIGACASMEPSTPQGKMTFFVTSVNPGKGADLGGLAGADAHCQALASAVGAGKRTWRAYLSTTSRRAAARQRARPHRQRARGRTSRAT